MRSRCTDPRHGSVWAPDPSGTLRKFDARRVSQYARHPVSGRVIRVRHYKQLARLERAAERNGTTFDGHVFCAAGPDALEAAERYFETGEANGGWVGSTNSEAMRGRRTPRRLALIRSLATLKPGERAEAQVARRVSVPTAKTVDWLHNELARRPVSDIEIIERLGYETKLGLLENAAGKLRLQAASDPSRCKPERLAERTRAMLDRLVTLGFDAAELSDLVIDRTEITTMSGGWSQHLNGIDTVARRLHERVVANDVPALAHLKDVSDTKIAKRDEQVVFYASVLAATREHPILSKLSPLRAAFLATGGIDVDDRMDVATWELVADQIITEHCTFAGRPEDDAWHVANALAVGGDPIKYRLLSGALNATISPSRQGWFPDVGGRTSERWFRNSQEWRRANEEYAAAIAGVLSDLGRQDAVRRYGTVGDAAWAHTMSAGLTFAEAAAVAALFDDSSTATFCASAEEAVGRVRALSLGAFSKALVAAQRDHDIKHAGYDLSADEVGDEIVVDELGFRHRTRRRARRGRRVWHPSAIDSAARLALCFNKQWPRYLEAGERASRRAQNRIATIHELTYWLPTGTQAPDFGTWLLQKNRVQAIFSGRRGEIGLRRLGEEFEHLSDEQRRTLSVEQAIGFLRARGYGPLGYTPLGGLCAELDVPPAQLNRIAGRWAGAVGVVTPLPIAKTWTDDNAGLRARFLPRGDPRGLYLGHLTDCCQYPGSAGESCAWAGHENPLMGFFVVEDRSGLVLAQSWVWSDGHGGLCFDNVERKTSTADGWNANWGVGNEPDPDNVLGDLDWAAMSPSQRRSWSIRALYQRAAQDCTDRFHTVTMGVAMTKIPLEGWPRANGNAILNPTGAGYNGYRDSHTQAVLARRRGGGTTTVISDPKGFAYRVGKQDDERGYRIAVRSEQVLVVPNDPEQFDIDSARARVVELLEHMGPRSWDVRLADEDGEAGDELEDPTGNGWVIEGDGELAVPDVSEYDVEGVAIGTPGGAALTRTVLGEGQSSVIVASGYDVESPEVAGLVAAGMRNGYRIVDMLKAGVRAEHLEGLNGQIIAAFDNGSSRGHRLNEALVDGSVSRAAREHPELGWVALHLVAVDGLPASVAQRLNSLDTATVSLAGRLVAAHGDSYVIKLLDVLDATKSDGELDVRFVDCDALLEQKRDLDRLKPYLDGGRSLATALALRSRVVRSRRSPRPWTPGDIAYRFPKAVARFGDRASGVLVERGIRAPAFNALAARVQKQFAEQPAARIGALEKIVDGSSAAGIAPKALRGYPKLFNIDDIAVAVEAGIHPSAVPDFLPSGMTADQMNRIIKGGTAVSGPLGLKSYRQRQVPRADAMDSLEYAELDDELREKMAGVLTDFSGTAAGYFTTTLLFVEAGIDPKVANSYPSDLDPLEVIKMVKAGNGLAPEVYAALRAVPSDEITSLVAGCDMDVELAVQYVKKGLASTSSAVSFLAGATPEEHQLMEMAGLTRWRNFGSDSTWDDRVENCVKTLAALRESGVTEQTSRMLPRVSRACGHCEIDGELLTAVIANDIQEDGLNNLNYLLSELGHLKPYAHTRYYFYRAKATDDDPADVPAMVADLAAASRAIRTHRSRTKDIVGGALRAADSVVEAYPLMVTMSEAGIDEKSVAALLRCGLSRKQAADTIRATGGDEAGFGWIFEGTSSAVRYNSRPAQQVVKRAKVLRVAAKRGVDFQRAGRIVEELGLSARRAVGAVETIEADAIDRLLDTPAPVDDKVALLAIQPTSTEVRRAIDGGLAGARTAIEAARAGRIVLEQWEQTPTDNELLGRIADEGYDPELVEALGPVTAAVLIERGVASESLRRAVAGARRADIDLDLGPSDWELAAAGSELLESVSGTGAERARAAGLIAAGMPANVASTLVVRLPDSLLTGPDDAERLAAMDGEQLVEIATCDALVVDDIDALEELCALGGDVAGDAARLSMRVGHVLPISALRGARERGDEWVDRWAAATAVPARWWSEADEAGIGPEDAQAFYAICDRFSPDEVAQLIRAGISPQQAAVSGAGSATLRTAARLGVLDVELDGRIATGEELERAVRYKVDRAQLDAIAARGVGWEAVGRPGALELISRGVAAEEALAAAESAERFVQRAPASLLARITAFVGAGLGAEDACWYADCSPAQAQRLREAGCSGTTYARYLDVLAERDLRPADRYAQILRWVGSGVAPEQAGGTDARARHHVATLR